VLQLDITGVLAKTITPSMGIPENDFRTIENTLKNYVQDFLNERSAGKHEWAMAPYDREVIGAVEDYVARIRGEKVLRHGSAQVETILWIGIGGSGLGPRVIKEVFETAETPELIVIDTIDPAVIAEELKLVDWKRTLVVIASKSGGTLEPMAAFFIIEEKLKAALGEEAKKRIVAITDPKEGVLKAYADKQGYATLPITPGIGGRYSIFTPIGLLPLLLLRADLSSFLRGAKEMDTLCQELSFEKNPAMRLAAVQFLLDAKRDYLIRVIMPYATRLQSLGRWEQQLLAESLGKTEAYGPSPVAGIGTQDQHSMLQQWIQGRRVAWHLFIREEEKARVPVPNVSIEKLALISGRDLGDVLDALYEGTAQSLTAAKRPHATISLQTLDEEHLGQLFYLFMVEVVLLGKLYRVDPYGQPGVEMGKRIAKEILDE
jgi:glucose-6-phosphate isomerase